MKSSVVAVLLLVPAAVSADQVFLKGGREISGVVVERTATHVTLEVGPGRVSLPLDRVERIQEGGSALLEYRKKRASLAGNDVDGFVALGLWCRDHELFTQAREAFEYAVALDPKNATAEIALGNVRLGERFVTQDEANRAQGLMRFEGSWMTPEERDSLLAERQEDARQRAEAAARRQAEADREAQAAAAAQQAQAYSGGLPYSPFGYGGGYLPYRSFVRRVRPMVPTVVVVPTVPAAPRMLRDAPPAPQAHPAPSPVMVRRGTN